MLDPFLPSPALLTQAITPVASFFNLTTLPLHAHEAFLTCAFYTILYLSIAPRLSRLVIPDVYASFNTRTRINWNVHIVSFVQSCLVCSVSLWVLWVDDKRANLDWKGRVWGYTGATGLIQALALGYFMWDFFMCARLGFRPFVNFYAPTFILYELSSPFLNIHWALDKLHLTGSTYQLVNGLCLITTFFCCRLMWGTYQSLRVFMDVWTALASPGTHAVPAAPFEIPATVPSVNEKAEVMRFAGDAIVPLWLAATYLGSNVVLNGLNWWWFGKMVKTIRGRFEPGVRERGETKKEKGEEGKAGANGVVMSVGSGAVADGGAEKVRKRRV
ncbi:MAG: hypothetical protein LQ340_005458 [Diploschistes diacapsis]|nr:MAG: hypothetical protein LQ340_005458 [Diploschistes diacapsis]